MKNVNRLLVSRTARTSSAIVATAVAAVALSSTALAADKAWSTAPANNAFSGTNWTPGTAAGAASTTVASGDALFFGTTSTPFLNNDLSGFSFAGVTFNTGAAAYTIAGNAFTLTGNMVNNSTARQIFLNSITLNQNTTFATNTGALQLNGSINGGTFALTKLGTGSLDLNAVNNYSGGTTVTGVLFGSVTGAFGTGAININAGAGNLLAIAPNITVANTLNIAGGGITGQGTVFVTGTGTSTLTGPINITGAQNAGGIFATANNTAILNIAGDNTINSSVPITVRNGRVVYSGAQSYTTGTTFNTVDSRSSVQFSKIVSMPAAGTVTVTQGNSIIANVGGAGEFTDGSGTATAGTIGGLLAGVGGQGAPVSYSTGSSLGIDTTNAAGTITYTSPWAAANNAGLLKLGTGTLALTNGGTYAGAGAAAFPLVVRQGSLNLNGGTHAVTGETVVGGNFGTAAGAVGFDARMEINNGAALNTSGFLSIGRGNGVGTVSSDLIVNNGTLTSSDFSLGWNANSALNLVKGSLTLNNASTYTVSGTNFFLAESAGSNGTITLNGTSSINKTSAAGNFHLGFNGAATVTLNDASNITVAANNAEFYVGRVAGSSAVVTLNGTSSIVQTGAAAGMTIGDGGRGVVNVASPTATVSSNALLIGHFGATTGVVYNKGTLANLANGIYMGDGNGGYGYLLNDNGTAPVANGVGGNIVAGITPNSTAIVEVASGSLGSNRIGVGFYQNGNVNGQYNVTGGTLNAGAAGFQVGDSATQTGDKWANVNVSGTGTLNSTGPISLASNNLAGNTGVLTVTTGGKVVADTITAAGNTAATVVNFGGGTLQAQAAGTSPSLITANVRRVQLDVGGMTVDTNGTTKSIDAVIADPAGFGVTQIALSGTGTGYIGRPVVKITDGSGSGATAVANWNPATGEVTGVTITSPGSGYTQPAVAIIGGGGTALTGTPVLDFSFGGGLTKIGAGTLSLTAANTYTGTTTVNGGTLRATTASYNNILTNAGGLALQKGIAQFDYTGGSSPVAQVKTILDAGYAGGFASGQIRGVSLAAGQTIGYGDNGTGIVTVRVTLPGDAELDGDVDFNDFLVLQNNFAQTGTRFDQANFNYDGVTDFNDFLALQNFFGQSVSGDAVAFSDAQVAALTAFAANPLNQAVPEPASLALIGLGVAGALRRRRR